MQIYVQLIGNIQLTDRLAFGVVPAFLRNPVLTDDDPESAFVLGVNGQIYTEGAFSFFGEWVFSFLWGNHFLCQERNGLPTNGTIEIRRVHQTEIIRGNPQAKAVIQFDDGLFFFR